MFGAPYSCVTNVGDSILAPSFRFIVFLHLFLDIYPFSLPSFLLSSLVFLFHFLSWFTSFLYLPPLSFLPSSPFLSFLVLFSFFLLLLLLFTFFLSPFLPSFLSRLFLFHFLSCFTSLYLRQTRSC